jgi:hypothetical protein
MGAAKLLTAAGGGIILDAASTATDKTITIPAVTGVAMTAASNANNAQFNTITGTAPLYSARAWVNFNGTGTVAIRASGNVSSITDNGTGDYTINFTNAMPDASYSWQFNGDGDTTGGGPGVYSLKDLVAPAAGSIRMQCRRINNVLQDPVYVTASLFR